ncbi:MAG: helix-turn-helix domain-containing protein [Clostridia bacterium]|nr:helix-turn-helix domain-containing protein [Clostridia bacterium]
MERLELLTKTEAAEILHISETTVERLIAGGQLPAYRIAKAVTRISAADVYDYLESRRIKTARLQGRPASIKDVKRRQRIAELPCPYVPGMKVVDPNG